MEDRRVKNRVAKPGGKRPFSTGTLALFLAALVVAAGVVIAALQIADLRSQVAAMQAAVDTATRRSDDLNARLMTFERTAANLPAAVRAELEAQAAEFENQIIDSGSALLKSTIALARKEMQAFGTAGHRFNVAEFDRRSCPQGGVFSGEQPDGSRLEKPFQASAMVEVRESHGDVRGIPFYRVSINNTVVNENGQPSQFRHGSMRVACN